jgi:hypothetical protein
MKNPLALLFSFVCLFVLEGVQGQNMYVRTNSNQTTYSLANIKKLTFSSGNLVVSSTTSEVNSYAFSSLRYLNFTDVSLGTKEYVQTTKNIVLYPNPVENVLHLSFVNALQGAIQIQICTLEGRVIHQQNHNDNSNAAILSIAGLPSGFYLCKASNGITNETIKFIKK